MKLHILILSLIIMLTTAFYTNAQTLKFFDLHLNTPSEFSNQKLNDMGFYMNSDGFYYGGLYGKDARLYIKPNSDGSKIKELIFTLPYLEKDYITISNASTVTILYTNNIAKQLKSNKISYNVPTFGSLFGNIIYCDDGYVTIYHDYSSTSFKGPIIIRYITID